MCTLWSTLITKVSSCHIVCDIIRATSEITKATMVSKATVVSKVTVAIMVYKINVTTMRFNKYFSSHCCNQDGESSRVSKPSEQSTGKEVCGAKHLKQQLLGVSPWCAVPGDGIAP
jgi:hypothetical protein